MDYRTYIIVKLENTKHKPNSITLPTSQESVSSYSDKQNKNKSNVGV